MFLGDSAVLLAQGVTDGVSEVARSVGGFVEEMDVMQCGAGFLAASKVTSGIAPMRTLVDNLVQGRPSVKLPSADQDASGKAEAHVSEVEAMLESLLKAPAAKQRASISTPGGAKPLKQTQSPGNASPFSQSSAAPPPSMVSPLLSSPAAIVGPAAIRHALAQVLQLDSTSPSDAATLDRMFATLHPAELAAFLPHDTPAVSLRMTIHLARARCATADRAHEMELALVRSTAAAGQRAHGAAVYPLGPAPMLRA